MYSELSARQPPSSSSRFSEVIGCPPTFHARSRFPDFVGISYELLCYCFGLLVAVFFPALVQHSFSLAEVLSMRISLTNLGIAFLAILLWALLLMALRPKIRVGRKYFEVVAWIGLRATACSGVALLLISARHPVMADSSRLALFYATSVSFILLGEVFATLGRLLQASARKERRIVIVGAGGRAQRAAAELGSHPRWKYLVLGFVDSLAESNTVPVVGGLECLENILMSTSVDEVLIAVPMKSMYNQAQHAVTVCERVGVPCRYSTDLFHTKIIKNRAVDEHDPLSVLLLHMVHRDITRVLKRALDIFGAGLGLLCLSPIMMIITIIVRLSSAGPVLFCQKRYGLNKRLFTIYKFRTMVVDAEQQQASLEHLNENDGAAFKMKRDPRVTKVGDFLRRTSLDELPQLWNVLIGDMSLVGPRPLPLRDVGRFSEGWLMRRFSVPPGITGLWQVSGRSNLSFSHWMRLDLEYIDHWSFGLDLQILAKTLPAVFRKHGAV